MSVCRQMLVEILKEESLRNYNILAPKGKSLAFTASLGGKSQQGIAIFQGAASVYYQNGPY